MKKVIFLSVLLVVCLSLAAGAANAKTLAEIKSAGKIVIGAKGDYPPWGVINAKNTDTDYETGTEFHLDVVANQFLG